MMSRSRDNLWGLPFWESPAIPEGVIIVATQEPTGERPVNNVVDFGEFVGPSWPWHPDMVVGPSPATRVTTGPKNRPVPHDRSTQLTAMTRSELVQEIERLDERVKKLQGQRRVLRKQVTHYNALHNEDIRIIETLQRGLHEEFGRANSYLRELEAMSGAFNAMSDTVHTTLDQIKTIRNEG